MRKRMLITLMAFAIMIVFTQFKNDLIMVTSGNDGEISTIIDNVNTEVESVLNPVIQVDNSEVLTFETQVVTLSSEQITSQNNTELEEEVSEDRVAETTSETESINKTQTETPTTSKTLENQYMGDPGAINPSTNDTVSKQAKYDEITEKYTLKMQSLENIAETALNDLIESAKTEYLLADPVTREKLDFKSLLASKYYALAKNLEDMLDKAVEENLSDFKEELLANQFDIVAVKSLNDTYQNAKVLRREEIMSDIMSKIWN